jgi:hypothetical protein
MKVLLALTLTAATLAALRKVAAYSNTQVHRINTKEPV